MELLAQVWILCRFGTPSAAQQVLSLIGSSLVSSCTWPRSQVTMLPDLKTIGASRRADMVWYLWKLCIFLCGRHHDGSLDYVTQVCALYMTGWRKGARTIRHVILESALLVATLGLSCVVKKECARVDAGLQPLLAKAVSQIDIVYAEILGETQNCSITQARDVLSSGDDTVDAGGGDAMLHVLTETRGIDKQASVNRQETALKPGARNNEYTYCHNIPYELKLRCLFTVFRRDPSHMIQHALDIDQEQETMGQLANQKRPITGVLINSSEANSFSEIRRLGR